MDDWLSSNQLTDYKEDNSVMTFNIDNIMNLL